MNEHRANGELPLDPERALRLREIMARIIEANLVAPVIVEGKRDISALRTLGLTGIVIPLNRGKSIYDFSEEIALRFDRVILLTDWDTVGDNLHGKLCNNLPGHWEEFSIFRETLRAICQSEIKDIEGIPKLLRRLEGDAVFGH